MGCCVMVDKKFRIHRDEHARKCKHCSKDFRTFVRTQEYCCPGCRYENQKIVEAAKAAAKKAATQKRIDEQRAKRVAAEAFLIEHKKKVRKPRQNNTPVKAKNPRAGKRPCGNCRVIFDSVDKVNNQRCAKCRALAESASGMREFKVGR